MHAPKFCRRVADAARRRGGSPRAFRVRGFGESMRVRLPLTRIAQISSTASRIERAFTPVFDGLWLDDAVE
jgi:hypothetical protein